MDSTRFDLIGSLALAGGLVCWGLVPVFLEALTGHVDPWVANGIRYPFAAILYWPVLIGSLRAGTLSGSLLRRAAVPASLSFCGQILWAMAPYHLSASLMAFLIRAAMLWAVAGAMVLFPEERALLRSRRFYLGVALAIVGLTILSLPTDVGEESRTATTSDSAAVVENQAREAFSPASAPDDSSEDAVTITGVAIILACSLFFGFYGVTVRQFMIGVHPILAFGVVCQPVAAGTFVLMLGFGSIEIIPALPARAWLFLCVSSFLGIGISHVFYYTAIHRLGASISASIHLLSPLVTFGAAFVFLGESLAPAKWFSGLVMIGGGGLILLAQEKVRARRQALLEAKLAAPAE